MIELIMQVVIGIVIIVAGILNMKGNISILHSYHRKRVKDEDIRPFGKKVGIGTIIIGLTVIAAGITGYFFPSVVSIIIIVGFIPGFATVFYALFKYNKGIF